MRNGLQVLATAFITLSAIAVVGCGSSTSESNAPDTIDVAPFQAGQGQTKEAAIYPAGPFGIGIGSVVPNFSFVGFANSKVTQSALQEINLSDFYNPTGKEDYAAGLPYSGAKPKVILIDVSAVWCGPCNDESKNSLRTHHAAIKAKGGEFFLNLADGPDMGVPATPDDLIRWTTQYGEDFPAVIDPEYKLAALFSQDAFPANMIIDTTTMQVCRVTAGDPQSDPMFWDAFDNLLSGAATCAGK